MSANIIIPWTMVYITNDVKEFEIEESTVGVCLEYLIERIPRRKPEILSKDGDKRAVMTLIAGG